MYPTCMRKIQGRKLTDQDRAVYDWQLDVTDFGEAGQEKLKGASVLISRCGGLGGVVAYELAAAGVGRLILAHGGNLKPSDLNRQILMTHDWLGRPRVECAARRLRELNPSIDIVGVGENVNESNAKSLVAQADLVVDCAPLFAERYALNRETMLQAKPMVECAVYELEGHLTVFIPGQTGCLRCLYPESSPSWRRRFPIFGAVSGTAGAMAAMETIKLLAGFGTNLAGHLLVFRLRDMSFRRYRIRRNPDCEHCGKSAGGEAALGGREL
jgi:molybdopterin-synthase adenylyltransferase